MATLSGAASSMEELRASEDELAEETLAGDEGSPARAGSHHETLAGEEPLARPRRRRSSSLRRGATIGRYVVLDRIGQGGMGVVHVAYDPELDRKLAVKVLVPRGSDEADAAARQRLVREAQAMARVSHPNVVAVHDVGVHDERVFVAMELVEGITLTRWLAAAPRPIAAIVALFVQAGRGLAAAHAKGLVHRDFKPDNVMVREGDAGPRAQVMDFGLVRALGEDEPVTSADGDSVERSSASLVNRITHFGQVLGTPSFMAPEQYEPGPIDARADQFAFCVALWEAAFGAHPFGGDDPAELVMRVVSGDRPEPPPAARANPRLRAVLDRGLRPSPDERWPSMNALLAELERDPSRVRRRVLAALAGVAAVGLLVGGERLLHARAVAACEREGASIEETWGMEARERVHEGMLATSLPRVADSHARLEPWLDRHARAWREARTQACLATEVEDAWAPERHAAAVDCLEEQRGELQAFVDVLARADRETVDQAVIWAAGLPPPRLCVDERYLAHQVAPPSSPEARAEHDALRAELAQVRAAFGSRNHDEARALLEALRPRLDAIGPSSLRVRALELDAALELAAGRYEAADARYREAFALALELGAVDLAATMTEQLAAVVGQRLGRFVEGEQWLDVAAGLQRRFGEPDDGVRMADLELARAGLRQRQGKFEEGLALAEHAFAIHEASLGADHPALARDLQLLAMLDANLGDYAAAETLARRAVAGYEAALGPAHPMAADARHTVAEMMRSLGRNDEALQEHRRALAIKEHALPPDHPDLTTSLVSLGMSLQHAGLSRESRPLLERALAIQEASLGPDHVDIVRTLVNLGNAQQSLQELDAALATYRRGLAIADAKLDADHPFRGVLLVNLGNTEIMLTRHEEAAAHLRQALGLLEAAHGPTHPNVALVLINLASASRKLDRLDEALAADRRALSLYEGAFGPEHPEVAYPLVGLALTELERHRPEAALPLAERALAIREGQSVSDEELAHARWTTARALGDVGRDLARARRLAEQALPAVDVEAAGLIRDFLARHAP
jgi:tetratricopeptide (TPR) repeat protein